MICLLYSLILTVFSSGYAAISQALLFNRGLVSLNICPVIGKSEPEEDKEAETKEEEKRGITYQIAKNKGLTPHRKKEQRNPRVKHRSKFRKAKIRRKGQVR